MTTERHELRKFSTMAVLSMENMELREAYSRFLASLDFTASLESRCSAPLLLTMPPTWSRASFRLVVVGQETLGWGEDDMGDLGSVRHDTDGIERLMRLYEKFDFAANRPQTHNSPFWRAFRHLESNLTAELLWTNLFRFDVDGGSVIHNCSSAEVRALLEAQHGLLEAELGILNPDAVVFFTGPDYDSALLAEFPGARFTPIADHFQRQFARIDHPSLPKAAFRLYHPGYLARSRARWTWLDELVGLLQGNP